MNLRARIARAEDFRAIHARPPIFELEHHCSSAAKRLIPRGLSAALPDVRVNGSQPARSTVHYLFYLPVVGRVRRYFIGIGA